jgi:two-component system, LuxR family, sensor kinase FixL
MPLPQTATEPHSPSQDAGKVEARANGPIHASTSEPAAAPLAEPILSDAHGHSVRYQEFFEFAPDGYVVTNSLGVILEANHAAASLLQCSKAFLIGKPLGLFVIEGYRSLFYHQLVKLGRAGAAALETRMGRSRTEPCDVALTAIALTGEYGLTARFGWLLRDRSAVRQAQEALRAERQLLDSIVDTAEALILVVDADGRVLRSNAYLHAISGYHPYEVRARDWCSTLLPEADRRAGRRTLEEAALCGVCRSGVLGFTTKDGQVRAVTWSARGLTDGPAGAVVLVGHDVTELQEAQEHALQAERLAAIGQVAAGLAHESRNALQRSQACLSMLGLRLKGQPEALDLLDRAQKAQDDLHRLFDGVRAYAAPIRLEPAPCSLADIWREAWDDLSPWENRVLELREETAGMDLRCVADSFHLKRVFRNVLENALAAASDPVCIVISCTPARLREKDALRISVRDNGPGFPVEHRDKLFEPFFTTKARGTGLGLAISKRIVEAHGGRIAAGHGPGPGAEIIITLPPSTS